AALAVGCQPVKGCTSDHDCVSPQCERLGDVAAAAKAAVDDDRQPIAEGRGDLPENLDGGYTVIELPAAMVGEHDAVAPGFRGAPRVRDGEDTLDQELSGPVPPDPGNVSPGDRGLEHLRDDRAAADRARRAGRQKCLDIVEAGA